ncbi:hypothetical protein [Halosimplex halophilum]|uniref:hypothetical protein n=1 Tax=Halosimplex halophilum TaxID=2559572 RepID=UPI0014354856|nr:hypothetical protein [Halosimplex halophilum]
MDLPPGVYTENVDTERLREAFRDRLSAIPHRAHLRVENSTGPLETVRTANDSDASLTTLDDTEDPELTLWIGPTEAGVAYDGKTWYLDGPTDLRDSAKSIAGYSRQTISNHLEDATWEPVGVRPTDEGDRVVLNATGLATDTALGTDGDPVDVRGIVDVTGDGRIVNGTITYTVDYGGETDTRTVTFGTERASGDFVSKPNWVSDPPQVTAEVTGGDRLVELSLTGGPAVDAGTRLSVNDSDWPGTLGTVTLDERLDPGETAYIYRTGESDAAAFHVSVGERPTLPENATAFTEDVYVHGREGEFIFQAGARVDGGTSASASLRSPPAVPSGASASAVPWLAALAPVGLFARRAARN